MFSMGGGPSAEEIRQKAILDERERNEAKKKEEERILREDKEKAIKAEQAKETLEFERLKIQTENTRLELEKEKLTLKSTVAKAEVAIKDKVVTAATDASAKDPSRYDTNIKAAQDFMEKMEEQRQNEFQRDLQRDQLAIGYTK